MRSQLWVTSDRFAEYPIWLPGFFGVFPELNLKKQLLGFKKISIIKVEPLELAPGEFCTVQTPASKQLVFRSARVQVLHSKDRVPGTLKDSGTCETYGIWVMPAFKESLHILRIEVTFDSHAILLCLLRAL